MRPATILVIDDQADVAELAAGFLRSGGHRVLTAHGGREGLRLFLEHPVDLAVVDILMPDLGGVEVILAIRKSRPDAPIVAVSGGSFEQDPEAVLRSAQHVGALCALRKPFRAAELLAVVERCLGSARRPPGSPWPSS